MIATMTAMTSLQRVLTAVGHREPDRVPFFLLVTMHGARELGISIKEYFSRPEYVAEGQLRLQAKYGHDCLYSLFYAAVEAEAWGLDVIYREDGPPNAGKPFYARSDDIRGLRVPKIQETPCLSKVLRAIAILKERAGDNLPVIGVVISPFSLPVMQLGFERYIQTIYQQPEMFTYLTELNEEFCVSWANAQLEAGATVICYFDPVSSPTIVPRELFLRSGYQIAKRTIARIRGPVATHLASARCLPIVDDLAQTGTLGVGASAQEDLSEVKQACLGKLAVLGNLNGIEMRRWTPEQAEDIVKRAIAGAGRGGGFVLTDNHGEIPFQVPDTVLATIAGAVNKWGHYPLDWVQDYGP